MTREARQGAEGVDGVDRATMQSGSSVADSDPGVRSRHEVPTGDGFAVKELNWAQRVLRIFIPVKRSWS
jgi:hypothetical protein